MVRFQAGFKGAQLRVCGRSLPVDSVASCLGRCSRYYLYVDTRPASMWYQQFTQVAPMICSIALAAGTCRALSSANFRKT